VAAKLLVAFGLTSVLLGLAAPASADRQLVRHRPAIGKVRLGMSVAEVRRLLGPPRSTTRELRGRNDYVEHDWDDGWWTVGFAKPPGGGFRAVMVGTVQRAQRTPEGLGPGATRRDVKARLPATFCRNVQPVDGSRLNEVGECVYGGRSQRQTVFVFNLTFTGWHLTPQTRIVEVQVRDPLFYAGWKVRFEPE
jgi:hypothetical protein